MHGKGGARAIPGGIGGACAGIGDPDIRRCPAMLPAAAAITEAWAAADIPGSAAALSAFAL